VYYAKALTPVNRRTTGIFVARETTLPQLVQLRLSDDLAKRIDDFRRKQEDIPTRSEAIRRLVEKGLQG
jgi:hypothetical protein